MVAQRLLIRPTGLVDAAQVSQAGGELGVPVLEAVGRVRLAVQLQRLLVVAQRLLVLSTGGVYAAQVVDAGGLPERLTGDLEMLRGGLVSVRRLLQPQGTLEAHRSEEGGQPSRLPIPLYVS